MKKSHSTLLVVLSLLLAASCAEEVVEKDPYGVFELTLCSQIGNLEITDLQISDGDRFLFTNEAAFNVDDDGTVIEFKVHEGTYNNVTLSLAETDGRTGLFTLKKGAEIAVNGGGRTKCTLTITSLKDNSTAEESILPNGRMFNMAIKALTLPAPDSLYCVYQRSDSLITSIKFINESSSTDGVRIDSFDGAPAYAVFDKATGALTISTSAKRYRLSSYPSFMFTRLEMVETIDFGNMYVHDVYKLDNMFSHCSKLKALDLSFIENTSECNSMDNLFSYCSSLESIDITHFNTANVVHMRSFFNHCSSLKSLDLSNFDTSNCKNMTYMFYYASSLEKLDLSTFSINQMKGSDMNYFLYCTSSIRELRLPDDFYVSDKASPTSFFTSSSLATTERTGSAGTNSGSLTIYAGKASIDWLVTTTLRWINSGYKNMKAIPVTFIDNTTGLPVSVKWPAN